MSNWVKVLIAAILLLCTFWFGHHVSNETWQAKWNGRDSDDALAVIAKERAERQKESDWLKLVDEARTQGEERINKAAADAAAANAQSVSLHKAVDLYARKLLDSQKRIATLFPSGGNPTPSGAGVLPELFEQADNLAGIYAKAADDARARALTCQQYVESIRK